MSANMLADDPAVVARILDYIDEKGTDRGEAIWREPVENYRCVHRYADELALMRRSATPFCPSAALSETGAFVARNAGGTPLLAVRDVDGRARVFRNACRHRGTQVAGGAGCAKAFVCRYHGWTYDLDGALLHVPHEDGFPGLDKSARGLVEVSCAEAHGVVFVNQGCDLDTAAIAGLPRLIAPELRLIATEERDIDANWKILVEGFLEGYHIRSTHARTFYPLQYDNLNVVEQFGRNNRIAFPYRNVNKLRDLPAAERSADGVLTFVYHLFPNVMVATFPGRVFMVAIEPLAIDRTRFVTYLLSDSDVSDASEQAALRQGIDLVAEGGLEDREMACSIQRSLVSGANQFFEYGLFESAIGHFHAVLHAELAAVA